MTHRIELVRGDITKIPADAIVNAANANLTVGGYVGQAIHDAAGPELAEACLKVPCSRAGDAVITGACLLPARYVIHAVGASWHGGTRHEAEELARTYRRCFAFAAAVAMRETAAALRGGAALDRVTFALFTDEVYAAFAEALHAETACAV